MKVIAWSEISAVNYGKPDPVVLTWLLCLYALPVYGGALLLPAIAVPWIAPLCAVVWLIVLWWINRRTRIRDDSWEYTGLFCRVIAPLDSLHLAAADNVNYRAFAGPDTVTIYGYAWYPAAGHPLESIGVSLDVARSSQRGFERQWRLLSPWEIASLVPIVALVFLDSAAST